MQEKMAYCGPYTQSSLEAILCAVVLVVRVKQNSQTDLNIRIQSTLRVLLASQRNEDFSDFLVRVPSSLLQGFPGLFWNGVAGEPRS